MSTPAERPCDNDPQGASFIRAEAQWSQAQSVALFGTTHRLAFAQTRHACAARDRARGAARAQIRLPDPAEGALDQTFRLIVRPDIWGDVIRLRFANTFGAKPVTLDDLHVGLQSTGGNLARDTNQPVTFKQKQSVVLAPGETVYSDYVKLPYVK